MKHKKVKDSLFGIPFTYEDELVRYLQWDKTLNLNEEGRVPMAVGFNSSNIIIQF